MLLPESAARIARRLWAFSRQRGPLRVLADCLTWGAGWVLGRLGRTEESRGAFTWEGRPVRYFAHPYNYTWMNERAVEVALAAEVLRAHGGQSVLEVGNVTRHYLPGDHPVVDKYERAEGVSNTDVVDLDSPDTYDLILTVSTLEHVGLDEDVLDPEKPVRAIEALKRALKPGGLLWMTIPVGYNPDLDRALRSGRSGFTRTQALRRHPRRNLWRQVPPDEVWSAEYDRLLYTAHGLVVAEYRKEAEEASPAA